MITIELPGQMLLFLRRQNKIVIPAKAGSRGVLQYALTTEYKVSLDSRLRGNDGDGV